MKINIAFLAPEPGIGGGNRKYGIYYKYLDPKYFEKYFVFLRNTENDPEEKDSNGDYSIGLSNLPSFLYKNNIEFVYPGIAIPTDIQDKIRESSYILRNISFTGSYSKNPRDINLIISKTDYWKRKFIEKENSLNNSHVAYNPIDVQNWLSLDKKVRGIYREQFKDKKIKFVVGRIARAEPSKWNFLIIKTLIKLNREKNSDYGFVFVGMPLLYRAILKISLGKKLLSNIIFLPEMSDLEEIAEFYKSINLFWQTSLIGESFGNVIAEAYCFGVPTITDYKKFLDEDMNVDIMKYDTQIELVDHEKTGAYCNYSSVIIDFLKSHSRDDLVKMGQAGKQKAIDNYDAQLAGNAMAKILYGYSTSKSKTPESDKLFDSIKQIPSLSEVEAYRDEYLDRIATAIRVNQIPGEEFKSYLRAEKIWNTIEFIYLGIRKLLKKINIDIEK